MRVLLDESLPHDLRPLILGHEVHTVQGRGWAGTKNGALLALAAAEFDVFVTADRNLPYQQDLRRVPLGVVILTAHPNRIQELRPLIPQLTDAIASVKPGEVIPVSA